MLTATRVSLHLRGTPAVLIAALAVAGGSLVAGTLEVPVPTNLVSSAAVVPYMTLAPTLIALALISRRPYGSEWMERAVPQPAPLRNVDRALHAASALMVTVIPAMADVSAGLITVCWRNVGLLSLLGALAVYYLSRTAAALLTLLLALAVFSFGSSASGAPHPWALLLLGPDNAPSWIVLSILAVTYMRLRRRHPSLLFRSDASST